MKVLIVEDEHKIAQSLKKALEHEHYIVDVSFEGVTGFDLASSESYDLIILDRLLPGMDGITICQKLRSQDIHTPILMLTAKGQIEDRVEGLDSGADDYLVKPFALSELFARIRALTRRPKHANTATLTVDGLILNPQTYEVKRNEKPLRLSSKEFSLLEYLMRHPNKILTKEQIMDHVWSYDADVLPNSVEVYIKHLRDKIDVPFSGPSLIHTVRGFGYKIGGKA
ncbi:MAG TPA: response regulator transcription factor [Patescibacteria group bacterium]|nr:response regulator transcription factor [Patescibacteria group bacterium]